MRALGVVVVAACSFEHGRLPASAGDAGAGDGADGSWSSPVEITELTSGFGDDDPSLTSDLLEIYWGSRRGGGAGAEDIWVARRGSPSEAWGMPVNVAALNTTDSETTIRVTADGLAIFFTRFINNDADLYVSTRASRSSGWQPATRIAELSTNEGEYGPYARNDLRRVVFCRGSNVPNEALWVAERNSPSEPWAAPNVLVELNEAAISECDPIELADRVLYFASNRTADMRYDIYRSERAATTGPYGPLAPISEVNLANVDDRDVWVSADERTMVFSSNRAGGSSRLYLSTR